MEELCPGSMVRTSVMTRPVVLALVCCTVLGSAGPARAQATRSERSTEYWVANSSLTVGFGLIALGASFIPSEPMVDQFWFGPDRGVTRDASTTAASISDVLVVGEMTAPVAVLGFGTSRSEFANGMLVYAQAHSVSFALNSVAKYLVRRPRPYTYRPHPRMREASDCQRVYDDCLSFYSGHASASFTAAFAGGYLVNETVDMSETSHALTWGLLMTGAAATAHLRVRAGKHFYSDVIVGSLLGATVGTVVPILHGGKYTPAPLELGAGAAGLALGSALPLLLPTDELPPELVPEPVVIDDQGVGLRVSGVW